MSISSVETSKGITVFISGKPRSFSVTHPSFDEIRAAVDARDEVALTALIDIRQTIANRTVGRVQILDTTITVDGREVSGRLVDRILQMVTRGSKAVDGYIKFLDNLMSNPSKRAVDELYLFVEACDLPVTPDGHFLAYKRVREDYTDIHSGTFDNSVGTVPSMHRNEVDDVRDNLCSNGLHFCSYTYLPHFGRWGGNRVMVVKINPADVVSIPSDYDNAKGRTCRYEVVGEIEDWVNDRITSWYTDEYDQADDDLDEFDDDLDEFDDDLDDGLPHGDMEELMDDLEDLGTDDDDVVKQALSANQVRDIKRNYLPDYHAGDTTLTAIGKAFGVHRETIARIDRGDIWREVS